MPLYLQYPAFGFAAAFERLLRPGSSVFLIGVPTYAASYNAETMRVIREADAGRDLHRYSSVDALFEDLGD